MTVENILDALTYIDETLITQAEDVVCKRKKEKKLRALAAAACAVLILSVGSVTAYSSGLFDGILQYFGGDAEEYLQKILADELYSADNNIEMRIHGVTASEQNVHLLVSLNGISEYGKRHLEEIDLLSEEPFAIFSTDSEGNMEKCSSFDIGTHVKSNVENVQYAFLINCKVKGEYAILYFENLSIEVNLAEHRFETISLHTEKTEANAAGNVRMSAVSFSFTLCEENLRNLDIKLIKDDGSIYEDNVIGYHCGTTYNQGDKKLEITGYFCEGSPVNNAVLNLEKFCGLQINGQKFYYKEPV